VHPDWDEQSKVLHVEVDQHKARLLGLSTQDVANFLNTSLRGLAATSYREGIESIDVVLRADALERDALSMVSELSIPTRAGKPVPLGQVASIRYGFEQGLVWRRNREPAITVRGQIYDAHPGAHRHRPDRAAAGRSAPACRPATASRPAARWRRAPRGRFGECRLPAVPGGGVHGADGAARQLLAHHHGGAHGALGLIGVVLFLLLFNQPFGFVAMLGTIALFGMIMRNSVILVDQIEQDVERGLSVWDAIVESAVRRLRPIALTAAAAVLAMIPLTRSTFFGPMAVAIMGGLIVATLLTLLFVPALYAAWYRVRRA
jgi:multidrug efflux pump